MKRTIANSLWLAATLALASSLAGCGSACNGCGTTCPVQAGKTFNVTLLAMTSVPCAHLPFITNTLAQLTVLQLASSDSESRLAVSLTSFTIPLDIGLAGNLCAPSGNATSFPFHTSFVQRNQVTGPIITYALDGAIDAPPGKEPTASGTFLMTYNDPDAPDEACSVEATFSPI